ncbi:MAG: response regulator [Eggerthellaceae bacterium]|nr:response regulator [Eggerthellaceae bacterium]
MERILESCKRIFERSNRPFGIAKVDLNPDGTPSDITIEYLNPAMAASAESLPEDLLGKKSYDVWPDGDRTWLSNYYKAAYQNEAVQFETVNVAFGTFQSVSVFPIVEGYCAYELTDVTAWMTNSQRALESVSAGMFFYDARTQLILLTDPAKECCGLDEGYLPADEFAERVFEDGVADHVARSIVGFSREDERRVLEEPTKNGKWLRMSMSHPEASVRFAVGFLEDITLLKEIEAKSARRSEIIESLSSEYYAMYIVNVEGDRITPYLLRNDVAKFFAKDIQDSTRYTDWLTKYCDLYVVGDDKNRVCQELSPEHIDEQMESGMHDYSVVCQRLFGDEAQFIELRIIGITGDAKQVVLAARNINDEMRNQLAQKEALQTALTLAKHASEAKTTFLTNVSHDLRTPLNSIMGFSNLALEHLDDAASVQNSLEKISAASHHLLDLINEILDVSRIESGKMKLDEKPLNLLSLAKSIEEVFYTQAKEAGISLEFNASGIHDADVLGDAMRIKQIVVNTVGNAIKYTSAGGNVWVSFIQGPEAPNGKVMYEICVKDTGIGMSAEFLKRIFQPFERANATGAHAMDGTGLGMTITKNLVELIGGGIKVESEEGVGSEFIITLPLRVNRQAEEDAQAAKFAGEAAESVDFSGHYVLVVDDDELSRELMAEILSSRGFQVEEASGGQEAVDAVKSSEPGHFSAVIMDMRMPGMPGDEATRAIRALPRQDAETLPVIAVTADAFEEGHRRSREAGMTAHLTKPVNTRELLAVLKDTIAR